MTKEKSYIVEINEYTGEETEFVKCKVCGAVGNWIEFIEAGECHKKKK